MTHQDIHVAMVSNRHEFPYYSTLLAGILRRTRRNVAVKFFCRGFHAKTLRAGKLTVEFISLPGQENMPGPTRWDAREMACHTGDWEKCLLLGNRHIVLCDLGAMFDSVPVARRTLEPSASSRCFEHVCTLVDLSAEEHASHQHGARDEPIGDIDIQPWLVSVGSISAETTELPARVITWPPGNFPWAKSGPAWALDCWESERCSWEALRMGDWEKPLAIDINPAGLGRSLDLVRRGWRVLVETGDSFRNPGCSPQTLLPPDLELTTDALAARDMDRRQVRMVRFGASGGRVEEAGDFSGAAAWLEARHWSPPDIVLQGPVAEDEWISLRNAGYRGRTVVRHTEWMPGGVDPAIFDAGTEDPLDPTSDWGWDCDIHLRHAGMDNPSISAPASPGPVITPGRKAPSMRGAAGEWKPSTIGNIHSQWLSHLSATGGRLRMAPSINIALTTEDAASPLNATLVHSIVRRTQHPVHVRCYHSGKGRESFHAGSLLVEFVPASHVIRRGLEVPDKLQVLRDHPRQWERCWLLNQDHLVMTDLALMHEEPFGGGRLIMAFPHPCEFRDGDLLISIKRDEDQFHLAGSILNLSAIRTHGGWESFSSGVKCNESDSQLTALSRNGLLQPLSERWHHGVYQSDFDAAYWKIFPHVPRPDRSCGENFGIIHFDGGPRPWEFHMAGPRRGKKERLWFKEYATWEMLEEEDWSHPEGCRPLEIN